MGSNNNAAVNASTFDIGCGIRLVHGNGSVIFATVVSEAGRQFIGESRTLGVYIIPRNSVQFDAAGARSVEYYRDELAATDAE